MTALTDRWRTESQTSHNEPVFIGGAGRSGTTLVVDMLGLHPRLSPIYETDFVLLLMALALEKPTRAKMLQKDIVRIMDEWTKPLPHRPHNKREHEKFHHGAHHILFDRLFAMDQSRRFIEEVIGGRAIPGLRALVHSLFAEHCRLDGKPRWINKTPDYVQHLKTLHELFPDLRFIHCIRDGRDIACSVMTRPWGPKTIPEAAAWWKDKIQSGVEFGKAHPTQYLEVRFEDVVRDPAAQLRRILAWLGEEDCSAQMLAHYREGVVSLDESRIGDWKARFSSDDLRAFTAHAGHLLEHFRYTAPSGSFAGEAA
jgi:hypothetical protein